MSRPVKIVFLILQFVIAALVIAFCVHLYINGGFTFGSLIASGDTDHVMTTAIHTLLLLLFGLVFFIVFGKATYPEVSFIIIAASFMQLMNLRVFLVPLDHLTIDTSILIQRGYYALWFFSMSLIFCSGLFHNGGLIPQTESVHPDLTLRYRHRDDDHPHPIRSRDAL